MGLSSSIAGAPTGWLVKTAGYQGFFLITILAGIPGMLLLPWLRGPRATGGRQFACESCGYDLQANPSGLCPECGAISPMFEPQQPHRRVPQTSISS